MTVVQLDTRPKATPKPGPLTDEEYKARRQAVRAAEEAAELAEAAKAYRPAAETYETRLIEAPAGFIDPPNSVAYYGLAGELVEAIGPYTEADEVGILVSILTIAGALFRGHQFEQGDPQTPNLFTVIVGQSGLGRKGLAQNIGRRVASMADDDWERIVQPGLESGQALPRTINERWAAGAGDPRMLILEGEFGRLLSALTRDGSNLSAMLRDAWDGRPLGRAVVSKAESAVAHVHHVGLLGAITDEELRRKLTEDDAANGFGNRVLWVAVRSPRIVPFPPAVHELVSEELVERLKAAFESAKYGRTHVWSDEARGLWVRWYTEFREKLIGQSLATSLIARGPSQVIRLAMTYELLNGAAISLQERAVVRISQDALLAAIALWDYAERSVAHVFGSSTGDPKADGILAAIPEVGDSIDWQEAWKPAGARRADEVQRAVDLLQKLSLVKVEVVTPTSAAGKAGGRKRRVITRLAR